jgi:hypothetical protein
MKSLFTEDDILPDSLATCLENHPKDASVWKQVSRRRDADGGGWDERAPKKSLMIQVFWLNGWKIDVNFLERY